MNIRCKLADLDLYTSNIPLTINVALGWRQNAGHWSSTFNVQRPLTVGRCGEPERNLFEIFQRGVAKSGRI